MGATMGRWGVRAGLVLMAIGAAAVVVHADAARGILDRARALEEGERKWSDRHEHLALGITTPTGGTRSRELDLYEKKTPGGDPHQKQLLVFRAPAEIRGTVFLGLLHRGRAAEQWLYLPEFKRTRQIVARMRDQPFVGTDLSNKDLDIVADLVTWTDADADASLVGETTVDGVACHQIALVPRREDIGYAKLVAFLGKEDLVARRLEFHDEHGLVKTLLQSRIEPVGTVPIGRRIQVDTPAANSRTLIEVQAVEIDQGIDDDRFVADRLAREGE